VIAGIDTGRLPDTIADRAIFVRMQRRRDGESVERLSDWRAWDEAAELEGWAARTASGLRDFEPTQPEGLDDRAAEAWEPLLSIADRVGGEWSARARSSANALSVATDRDDGGWGTQLLAAVRDAMDGAPKAFSATLVKTINANDDLPFGAWRDGKGLDGRGFARLLKPYGIKPRGTVRIGDDTAKGYHATDLADAWARYLRPSQASQASHADQQSPETPPEHRDVTDVTDTAEADDDPLA